MDDLVFAFNLSESRKSGCIILDSYLCTSKYNKQHKYSGGRIIKVSVWDDIHPNNYSNKEVTEIRNFFRRRVFSISPYQYLTNVDDIFLLIQNYNKNNFYYYINPLDMYYVEKCCLNNAYTEKGKDTLCSISGYDIIYNAKTAAVNIRSNKTQEKNIIHVDPLLKVIAENDVYRIVFEYQGIEVPYDSNEYIFEYDGNVIARRYDIERKLERDFLKADFRKKRENTYEYKGKKEPNDVLKQLGIKTEKESNIHSNEIKIGITKSDYDWFDLKISYDFGDRVIELGDKIDLFSNKKSVTIDGTRVNLPDSIVENIDKFVVGENGLRIPASNFWTVLQIASESHINLNEFVSYQNIQMTLTPKIEKSIRDYQRDGAHWLKWLFTNRIGGCLADDMGTGKTFQTIAFLSDQLLKGIINKVLIVVPYVLMINWAREFKKFSEENRITIYHGSSRFETVKSDNRIIITTYTTAMNDIDQLQDIDFDVIVFDEIQYLKNNSSKTYIALSKLNAICRIGLSGTPIENRIDELWNILNILNPGMMHSKSKFIKKYKAGSNDELHKLLNPFILRRTKDEVLNELPDKQEVLIYSEFSETQKNLYDSIRVAVKNSMRNYSIGANAVILKGLLLLREVCCHPLLLNPDVNVNNVSESCKFEALKIAVMEIGESGNKVIIYSQFVKMLKIIEKWCQDEAIEYFYMDGDTSNRQEVIDDFESSDQGVFLISLKAGGIGLNLTSAHFAIIYDPWWNPFVEQQAADRIYRMGQKHDVTIYKMIVSDSIEEKILNLQKSKQKLFSEVLDGISNDKIDLRELVEML